MKKKISINAITLLVLVIGLVMSLCANVLQFAAANGEKLPILTGSYGHNQIDVEGKNPYLVFDSKGNYCKYSQTDGLLDEGKYTQNTANQYSLTGDSGNTEEIILEENGLYYISSSDVLSVVFFPRFSDVPTFIGQWAESWPGWQE